MIKNIDVKIKELRLSKGITQSELSKAINFGQSTIVAWEKGIKTPTAEAIKELAKFFDVSADYLLGLKED
jgi:transcriptional regulator with XRE-family HTH domain